MRPMPDATPTQPDPSDQAPATCPTCGSRYPDWCHLIHIGGRYDRHPHGQNPNERPCCFDPFHTQPADQAGEQRRVYIARCPEHGLHGERDTCFVCNGPVEQVAMVPASSVADLQAERDRFDDEAERLGVIAEENRLRAEAAERERDELRVELERRRPHHLTQEDWDA